MICPVVALQNVYTENASLIRRIKDHNVISPAIRYTLNQSIYRISMGIDKKRPVSIFNILQCQRNQQI